VHKSSTKKENLQAYGIFSYEDRMAFFHLASNTLALAPNSFYTLYSQNKLSHIFARGPARPINFVLNFVILFKKYRTMLHIMTSITLRWNFAVEQKNILHYNAKVIAFYRDDRKKNLSSVLSSKKRARTPDRTHSPTFFSAR